jgi:pimeloyl-ACP methyl ester carboxylesterase
VPARRDNDSSTAVNGSSTDRRVAVTSPRPFREDTVALPDGRTLGFSEFGDPEGRPVLWFAGTPGGGRQIPPGTPELAQRLGLRIVSVERPGLGRSTHHPRRTLLSFAADVEVLVDAEGHERVGLIGLSGGGPHVLSTAWHMPDRVVAGGVLGGLAPVSGDDVAYFNPLLHWALQRVHDLHVPLGEGLSRAVQPLLPVASHVFEVGIRLLPPIDRPVLSQPAMKAMFLDDLVDVARTGLRSIARDLAVFAKPWGFDVSEIRVPIRIWHGTADATVPLAHGEWLAQRIPDAELVTISGEGHFAGFTRTGDVLTTISAIWGDAHRDASGGDDGDR